MTVLEDAMTDATGGRDGVGHTEPAGRGLDDEEMAAQVAGQTSSDLKAEDVFARDREGVEDPTEAARESADELRSDG